MSSAAADLSVVDAARILEQAIRSKSYQAETKLGASVAKYLAWKQFRASERTLVIYEGYLARLCVSLAYIDPAMDEVTAEMLLEALGDYPRGSWKLVRTTYSDFFRWAVIRELRARNPVDLLPKIPDRPARVYEIFTTTERAQLVKAADTLPLPWIQRLRVLCLLDLGIRKAEAAGLQPIDFDTTAKVVVVRGKGGKERVVPFGDELWRAFVAYRNRQIPNVRMQDGDEHWLEDRAPLDTDFLFFRYGAVLGRVNWADPGVQMSARGMQDWWAKYIVPRSGIRYRSMHMARHSLGTDLSTAGEDLATIQDWLGHASPDTTKIYVHNSRARLARGRALLDDFRSQGA